MFAVRRIGGQPRRLTPQGRRPAVAGWSAHNFPPARRAANELGLAGASSDRLVIENNVGEVRGS